jgi:hypothetical protein
MGGFRDLNPDVEMDVVLVIEWIALLASFSLTISSIIVWAISKKRKKKYLVVLMHFVILVAVAGLFIGCELTFNEAYKDKSEYAEYDPDANPYFVSIDLNELIELLNDQSGHEEMIYIARNDCAECSTFEEEIAESLRKNSYGLHTYYTNRDRDGTRSEEMYGLLDEYKVSSVPFVIVVKNKEVIQSWDNPTQQIAQIEALLDTYGEGIAD